MSVVVTTAGACHSTGGQGSSPSDLSGSAGDLAAAPFDLASPSTLDAAIFEYCPVVPFLSFGTTTTLSWATGSGSLTAPITNTSGGDLTLLRVLLRSDTDPSPFQFKLLGIGPIPTTLAADAGDQSIEADFTPPASGVGARGLITFNTSLGDASLCLQIYPRP